MSELDYSHPPDRPPTALKINGQIISTLGNFCAVIGKAKSRKTFFLTSIAAAALKGECLNVTSELPENKRTVLVFDTEQGKYHVYKTFDRIRSQAGHNNNLRIFQLREHATADRVQVIEEALVKLPNVGLVIIDGLRDLISDINSQEQATMINDKLLQWTSKFNIAIFIVIHQNKADSNARGHVGTEIVNKAETVLSVEKNSKNVDVSTVKAEYCRNMDFEPFSFLINDDGLPELTEFEGETTGRRSLKPENFDATLHHQILESIFKDSKELKYSEVQAGIISEFSKIGHSFGNNKSREFFNHYEDNGLLTRHGLPQSKNSYFERSWLTNHLG